MVWSEEGRQLSERLQVMAGKIRNGESCADIGTDHGYLGIYLYEKGISPFVVMTDISEASLAKAKGSAGAGQFGNSVDFRVGDGLKVLEEGEVDCVVIAGMGGKLIRDILAEDPGKTASFKRFVLQPRSASGPLRKWLLEAGFSILSEDIVREGDFLPEIITVAPQGKYEVDPDDFDYFELEEGMDLAAGIRNSLVCENVSSGEEDYPDEDSIHFAVPMWMLNGGGPVLEYLDRKILIQKDILDGMSKASDPDPDGMNRVRYNIEYLRQLREIRKLREDILKRRRETEERDGD